MMGLAYFLDMTGALDDVRRSLAIVIVCFFFCACGQITAVKGAAQDDADISLYAQREQSIQGALIQQGIASGQQKTVEIGFPGKTAPIVRSLLPIPYWGAVSK